MKLAQLSALALLLAFALVNTVSAGCGTCCCVCGKKVCTLEVSKEKESVTRYDVESKEICIPGIKFPWSCKRNCGGVRNVCVLKEVKEDKTVCKYDWSIKTICTTCCRRNGLKHHHASINKPEVNRDERIAFEFYAADPLPEDGRSTAEGLSIPTVPAIDAPAQFPFQLATNRPIVEQKVAQQQSPAPVNENLANVETKEESKSKVRAASASVLNVFRR